MTRCEACALGIAREDLVRVDGAPYHRQCAPDGAPPSISITGP